MVIALAWALLAVEPTAALEPDAGPDVRAALARGGYPWYDAPADQLKPVMAPPEPPPVSDSTWEGIGAPGLGQLLVFLTLAAALVAFCVALAWFWQRHLLGAERPTGAPEGPTRRAARTASLPAGLRDETGDPWAEALRLRRQGEHARAIVLLFIHQLLTLDRLRLSRLLPGRTGRQIVRAVTEIEARRRIEPTLRLFEAVYYGHHRPPVEAFEAAWSEAEAFERWAAARALP